MTRRTKETPLAKALWANHRDGAWLASRLGVHPSQVSRYVCGHVTPSPARQKRIAKALGVKVEQLWPVEEA